MLYVRVVDIISFDMGLLTNLEKGWLQNNVKLEYACI